MKYQGSCHCGAVAFELETDAPIDKAFDCNCSLCRRRGGLLWFGPRAALKLTTAESSLATYRFHNRVLDHHYCAACGIAPFSEGDNPADGMRMAAVNVRCLSEVDLATLEIATVDGASF